MVTRTKKADGTHPIAIRITFKRKSTSCSTGFSAFLDEWDATATLLSKSRHRDKTDTMRVNNYLRKRNGDIANLIERLRVNEQLKSMTPQKLFSLVSSNVGTEVNFFDEITEYRKQLLKDGKYANHEHYQSTYAVLEKFVGKPNLPTSHITFDFIQKFESWYLAQTTIRHGEKRKKCYNGLAPHLRRIRALINLLIEAEKFKAENSPFKQYSIKTEDTAKRFFTLPELNKILALELSVNSPQFHSRNYFMISFFMQGMSLIDLAKLKVKDIVNDFITYKRSKTKQSITIVVEPQLKILLNLYRGNKKPDDYLLPIINEPDATDKRIRQIIHNAGIKINDSLRKLVAKAELPIQYPSLYWARHSYASNMQWSLVPIQVISQMLGHESIETTKIYLAGFPSNVISGYNKVVFAGLTNPTVVSK